MPPDTRLKWAKSHDSCRRIASESYRHNSNHCVRWWLYLLSKHSEIGPHRPCVRCAAIRIVQLAFILTTFVPHGSADWPARVDRVRCMLARYPPKCSANTTLVGLGGSGVCSTVFRNSFIWGDWQDLGLERGQTRYHSSKWHTRQR